MANSQPDRLGDVVREKLRTLGHHQKWLAEQLKMTESELSKRLNEQKGIREDDVVHMAELLGIPLGRLLLLAAATRCGSGEAEARHALAKIKDAAERENYESQRQRYENARKEYRELLSRLNSPSGSSTPPPGRPYISLEDFPNLGDNRWTVIVADRRERPVKGLGDLLGLSVGSPDFVFLHRLSLPKETVARSDKTMLVAGKASLAELMNTNLLIIGSPAVSLGARAVLRDAGATFMFNIGNAAYDRERQLYEQVPAHAPGDVLEIFISRKDIRDICDDLLATFRKNGFVDPIDYNGIRGRAIARDVDYGMVALARNPWSPKHVTCICAGVHGGGTAGAVQLLASPHEFEKHPWGGVFRVSMSDQVPWERRFENLVPRWETHEYSPEEYLTQIDGLIARMDLPASRTKSDDEMRELAVSKDMLERVRTLAEWLTKRPSDTSQRGN